MYSLPDTSATLFYFSRLIILKYLVIIYYLKIIKIIEKKFSTTNLTTNILGINKYI